MKKLIINILINITIILVVMVFFAFIKNETNPFLWSERERFALVFVISVISLFKAVTRNENDITIF